MRGICKCSCRHTTPLEVCGSSGSTVITPDFITPSNTPCGCSDVLSHPLFITPPHLSHPLTLWMFGRPIIPPGSSHSPPLGPLRAALYHPGYTIIEQGGSSSTINISSIQKAAGNLIILHTHKTFLYTKGCTRKVTPHTTPHDTTRHDTFLSTTPGGQIFHFFFLGTSCGFFSSLKFWSQCHAILACRLGLFTKTFYIPIIDRLI